MESKICRDCGEDKPLTEYYKSKTHSSGYYTRCKVCHCLVTNKNAKGWYARNKENRKRYNKEYYEANKHDRLEDNRTRAIKWYWENRDKAIRRARQREVLQKEATPDWLSDEQLSEMKYIYDQASDCSVTSGGVYEVDHIIPIKHNLVCGLNVPWNLQILPMDLNRAKSNSFDGGW